MRRRLPHSGSFVAHRGAREPFLRAYTDTRGQGPVDWQDYPFGDPPACHWRGAREGRGWVPSAMMFVEHSDDAQARGATVANAAAEAA